MRFILAGLVAIFLVAATPSVVLAGVEARIDISSQTMKVYVNGVARHSWRISSGRGRYRTPTGSWRPTFLSRHHRSRRYNNAPMPFSVFFYRGYAIHGTDQVSRLGRPASHGCVRLHPRNASVFFRLVKRFGRRNTRIVIRH